MRAVLVLAALCLSGPALAGSIDRVKALAAGTPVDSVIRIHCTACPPSAPPKSAYKVATLKSGEQKLELRDVGGKQRLFRTEAWLGGSPVVFVSTPTPDMIAALTPQVKPHDPMGDGIDKSAKTAAVPAPQAQPLPRKEPVEAATGGAGEVKPLDLSGFKLR